MPAGEKPEKPKKKSSSSSLLVSIIEQSTPNNNTFSRNKQDNCLNPVSCVDLNTCGYV